MDFCKKPDDKSEGLFLDNLTESEPHSNMRRLYAVRPADAAERILRRKKKAVI